MTNIGLYKHVKDTKSQEKITFENFLSGVKNGIWQDTVINFRAGRVEKEKNPCVTPSGVFTESRKAANLTEHSGIINIDIDQKDNPEVKLIDCRDELFSDQYLYAAHISIGGKGLSLYFKIRKNRHLESFLGVQKYIADKYKLIIDPACKDVTRLRFVSYDPELFQNDKAKNWDIFIAKQEVQPYNFNPIFTNDDLKFIFQQIKDKGIDLTNSYDNWVKIGFSFASEFGEKGREYFHIVSYNHPQYSKEKTDKKFDNFLNSGSKKFSIGTFFWIAKQNGVKIISEKTKKIASVSSIRKKSIGKSGGCKDTNDAKKSTIEYLTKIEGFEKKDIEESVNKIFESENTEDVDSEKTDIEMVIDYINTLPLKFNLITNEVEYNNEEITDRQENTIFINTKMILPKAKISKDLIISILHSDRVKEYNPFQDFFSKYSYMKPTGRIENLLECINIKNNEYANYVGTFIEKWLISIIAGMHKIHSSMILVFIGEQMTGKTKFFRELLPEELQNYYAESKLDQGKDDEILMSKKLIIMDDEFSGKSKVESKRLKELSSKQKITARKAYGRNSQDYNRIAVLCGTSNDTDILNDPTGNRRIIPVHVENIDFEVYEKVNKTELFMELYWKYQKSGMNWLISKEEIKILTKDTEEYYEISLEEEMIRKYYEPLPPRSQDGEFFTATEMLNFCEQYLNKQRLMPKKFSQVLKKVGFERVQKRGVGYGYLAKKRNNDNNFNNIGVFNENH